MDLIFLRPIIFCFCLADFFSFLFSHLLLILYHVVDFYEEVDFDLFLLHTF